MIRYQKTALLSAVFLLLAPILSLSSCAIQSWGSPHERATDIATKAGFELKKDRSPAFVLTTFQSANLPGSNTLTVYIEGDGAPWISPTLPPKDPTPLKPLSLILASKDGRYPILYIARPCQYLDETELTACHYKYWTAERFSAEVVEAANRVIDTVKTSTGTHRVRLIGFSGGGVIAALLATRRNDTDSLVTVAAPLDIEAWSAFHQISPLQGSLNPLDSIQALSKIQQLHLVGEKDFIVPPAYARTIEDRMPFAKFVFVPGHTHNCCWDEKWPELLPKEWQ